jgi:glycosyltransferase involved in cell wall biosynthesis
MHIIYGLILGFLACTSTAHAAYLTPWDFTDSAIPGRWEVTDLDPPTPTAEGLSVKSETDGVMIYSDIVLPHHIDAVFVYTSSPKPTDAFLLWHERGTPHEHLVQYPFTIPASEDPARITFNVSPYPQWDSKADRIGFAFPGGSDFILHKVELVGFSPMEKLLEAWRTFWTFDRYTPYTINFVWGPLLTFNPIARDHMFDKLPPLARSGNLIFYGILLGICGALLLRHFIARKSRSHVKGMSILLLSFAILWIAYDIRMGLEFINYLVTDYYTYHSQESPNRSFREHHTFYDFVDSIKPHIASDEKYIFMGQQRWPYLGAIRYLTYPILPTEPTQNLHGVKTWVIYDRPDIFLNAENMLETDGRIFAGPGEIVHQFDDASFVFRSQ